MFVYHLPKIDNTTEFDLISGPYGATVMENGTLSWRAMSNLIADSWSELFIIKAKGNCFLFLIEATVLSLRLQSRKLSQSPLLENINSLDYVFYI